MLSTTLKDLPDLPQIRKKTEQKITPSVLNWFRKNYANSCAIEIKATNKNTIPEKALQDHQKKALRDAKHRIIVHKIADNKRRNPFDAFMLTNADAFVVACFSAHGVCLVIDVDEWKGARYDDLAPFVIKI